jgi:hypothetical protein
MSLIEEHIKCKEEEKIDVLADNCSNAPLLFDEEVANLLLDMRDKILNTKNCVVDDKTPSSDEDCPRPLDSPVSSPEIAPMARKRKVRSEEVDDEECESYESPDDGEWIEGRLNFISQTVISSSKSRKKAPSGSACEKHKRWKKRCPDNCPMRKANKNQRDVKTNYPTKYFEMVGWSMIELAEEPNIEEDEDVIAPKSEEEMEEEEEEEEEEKRFVKPKSKRSSKGRAGRKYLPQACERHKILHAKCPANCPDRLKRDAELAKQKDELSTNEMALP